MSRFHSYINTAQTIIDTYQGKEPFAAALKKFFAANKKYGSSDRKQITQLCYAYFRLGNSMEQQSVEEQLITGWYLSHTAATKLLEVIRPEWNATVTLPLTEKINKLPFSFSLQQLFPASDSDLSTAIDKEQFLRAHFSQPALFLRLRPGFEQAVIKKLNKAEIVYTQQASCLKLPNGTKVDELLELDKTVVVQDAASQQLYQSLLEQPLPEKLIVWDACAASGGKSLLLHDSYPEVRIFATDVRDTIIRNLKNRFHAAGITGYQARVLDLLKPIDQPLPVNKFNLILADVPCTGSGTWARTPEYLRHFSPPSIAEFQQLQQQIVKNVLPHLAPGGMLVYSTCSVFTAENEENTAFFQQEYGMKLLSEQIIKGYTFEADTMYISVLQLPE